MVENYAKRYLQTVRQQLSPLPAPPTADNLNKSVLWKTSKNQNIDDHEAMLTLSLRKEVDAEFSDRRSTQKILWSKIAKTMNEMGFYVGDGETGAEKCRQKFANLQSSLVKTNNKRKRTGEGKMNNPPYFDELFDILGDKHKTNSIMIIDSIAPTATASTSSSAEAGSSSPAESEGSSSSDSGRSSLADAGRSYSAEKIVEALKEINKANLEQRKEEFSQMMSLIQRQNEMRYEQILALIKSQDKKRKRGHSDSD
ncbi:hypothetical protein FQA39_LY06418 [Lamprigera yunnana]|nr:hypothetical protein FQA39_LY06418 [Lamprigera yunnana]